jgi:hypothetical protein
LSRLCYTTLRIVKFKFMKDQLQLIDRLYDLATSI